MWKCKTLLCRWNFSAQTWLIMVFLSHTNSEETYWQEWPGVQTTSASARIRYCSSWLGSSELKLERKSSALKSLPNALRFSLIFLYYVKFLLVTTRKNQIKSALMFYSEIKNNLLVSYRHQFSKVSLYRYKERRRHFNEKISFLLMKNETLISFG